MKTPSDSHLSQATARGPPTAPASVISRWRVAGGWPPSCDPDFLPIPNQTKEEGMQMKSSVRTGSLPGIDFAG